MPTTPRTDGIVRDPVTGGLLTVASKATDERIGVPPPKPLALSPAVAGLLGLLALIAAVPAAILFALPATVTAPAWLVTAAAVGTGLTPLFTALAYWSQGGNPLELLTRFAPRPPSPPPSSSAPTKMGPPEP